MLYPLSYGGGGPVEIVDENPRLLAGVFFLAAFSGLFCGAARPG